MLDPFNNCTWQKKEKRILYHTWGNQDLIFAWYYSFCNYTYTMFYRASLYCPSQILRLFFSLPIEGLWQPCNKQVCRHHFSNSTGSLHVSVSHFGNSQYLRYFHYGIFVMVTYGQWSLMLLSQWFQGWEACHELCPRKTEKLVHKCCMCSDCSTDWPFPLSPSLTSLFLETQQYWN